MVEIKKCSKCNKEITDKIVLNEYGVNIHSMPDQEGNMYYFCDICSEIMGLTAQRNKLNRQISKLKKVSIEAE